MRLRVFWAALLVTVVAVLAASGVATAKKPVGSCPDSYQLIRANVDPVVDVNGDGWICTKVIGGNAYSDIDNNKPT
jgi:hypothetical protein